MRYFSHKNVYNIELKKLAIGVSAVLDMGEFHQIPDYNMCWLPSMPVRLPDFIPAKISLYAVALTKYQTTASAGSQAYYIMAEHIDFSTVRREKQTGLNDDF